MPALLTTYEQLTLYASTRAFLTHFVQEKDARREYADTNQGIILSLAIAMIHALAEGARLTLILVDLAQTSSQFGFLVPIGCGMVWNIMIRAGVLDKALVVLTCGWRTPNNCGLVLQEVKYCMGYCRFFAVAAIALARFCTGNEVLPQSQEPLGWAVVSMLVAEMIEDLVSWVLVRRGLRVHPEPRQITDEEVEILVINEMKTSQGSLASFSPPFKAVVPRAWLADTADDVATTPTTPRLSAEMRQKCWKIRAALDFSYKEAEFQKLPFWAHFSAIAMAQFHTVLFIIILSNGASYVFGLCPESGYTGVGRGLLWWPVTNPGELCD